MKTLGLPVSEAELLQKFETLDVEGNGYLDKKAFAKVCAA